MISPCGPNKDHALLSQSHDNHPSFFPKVDSDFQWRYAFAMALAVGVTLTVFMTPFLYLLHQNFDVFYKLALTNQPNLVEHIEREIIWITTLGVGGMVAAVVFSLIFGYKLTGSILGPLYSLERHMKKIAQGNWEQEDFKIRSSDEFKRLAAAYSYLYRGLREDMKADLEALEMVHSLSLTGKNNDDIRKLASDLAAVKAKKLGQPTESRVAVHAPGGVSILTMKAAGAASTEAASAAPAALEQAAATFSLTDKSKKAS